MLNPAFSKTICRQVKNDYILPEKVINIVKQKNASLNTGPELRTQKIYGDELWMKMKTLGLDKLSWKNKEVLDICCGAGFLSFHLLSRITPKKLTLLDISAPEINQAEKLLTGFSNVLPMEYTVADATRTNFPDNSFDIIVGNSFLHHFYDLPLALKEFYRILKPGGLFITLHEPTVASVAVESRNPKNMLLYIFKGKDYLNHFRYKGEGVAPGAGADVWIFREKEIINLFKKAGLENIKTGHWHFLRPKLVAVLNLHPREKRKKIEHNKKNVFPFGGLF